MMNYREPSTIPEAWEWIMLEIVKYWLCIKEKCCKKSMGVQNATFLRFFKSLKTGRNVMMPSTSGKNCWLISHQQGKQNRKKNIPLFTQNVNVARFARIVE